jgi:hypothetical protein
MVRSWRPTRRPRRARAARPTSTTGSSASGTTRRADAPKSGDEQYAGYSNPVHSLTEDEAREAHEERLEQLRIEAEQAAEAGPTSHFNASAPDQAPAIQGDQDETGKR